MTTLLLMPSLAFADEDGLYAPAPPADSAFVRTINATSKTDEVIQINGNALNTENGSSIVSDYVILKEGSHKLSFSDLTKEVTLNAGKYYTLAVTADNNVKIFEDALIEDPTKATVYFCNFTKTPASLKSEEFQATLFENIETLTCDSREINAVDFDLNVFNADGEIKNFPEVSLKRQIGTSIIVTDNETYLFDNKVSQ